MSYLFNSCTVGINECKTMYSSWQLFTADANYCLWIHPLASWRSTASSSTSVCMWWARLFHGLSPWPTRVHWPPFSAWTPPHVSVQKPARSKRHPRSLPKHARSGCRFLWWPDGVNFITATNENEFKIKWWLEFGANLHTWSKDNINELSCIKSN